MSVSQAQNNKYPVVSLPSGSQSANKYIAANLKMVISICTIVICFDSDEPGMVAAEKAIKILPPGKAAICRLPRKDANEMLIAGEGKNLEISYGKQHLLDQMASLTPLTSGQN